MATGDMAITCSNSSMVDFMTLIASCFGKTASGKIYLRVHWYTQSSNEEDAVSCTTNNLTPEELFEQLARMAVVKNAEGKNSIMLGHL